MRNGHLTATTLLKFVILPEASALSRDIRLKFDLIHIPSTKSKTFNLRFTK